MRHMLTVTLALFALTVPASAQRAPRPTRGDFERAMLDQAPTEIPAHPCQSEDPEEPPIPARTLSRTERATMLGRMVPLPDGRIAAIVRIPTGESDPNEALAYSLTLVVLAHAGSAWTVSARTDLDTESAPYEYEDGTVVIARLEDLDDDHEREMLVVLDTNTETACGPGYCSQRRTLVIDVGDADVPVLANVMTQNTCQSDMRESETGTVMFRDTNGDGHRDLVHRRHACDEPADYGMAPHCATSETTRLYDASTDRYAD